MAQLSTKIELYAKANGKTVEFNKDVVLEDYSDGKGVKITTWNVSGLAKPNDDQLASYNSAATTQDNNHIIRRTRKAAYGDIGDQLDLLYKDMLADKGDKTGEWFKAVKAVKDANSKEQSMAIKLANNHPRTDDKVFQVNFRDGGIVYDAT